MFNNRLKHLLTQGHLSTALIIISSMIIRQKCHKFLARTVTLTTINLVIKFSACMEITFKIQSKFLKASFFVTNLPERFKAILGYQFLMQHKVHLNMSDNELVLVDLVILFLSHDEISSNISSEVNMCYNTSSTTKVISAR